MNRTAIGWTHYTWNPGTGCEEEGPECKHCYAKALAEQRRGTRAFPNGFDWTERRHKLTEPIRLARKLGDEGALVFVNSMTDLFWSGFDAGYARECVEVMADCSTLRFQLLTKRAEAMAEFFARRPGGVPSNVWIGVTCGHSSRVWTVDVLRQIETSSVRFVSAEPLLGDLTFADRRRRPLDLAGIHWLISGGESGHHIANDPDEAKARALVERGPGGKGWIPRADRVPWIRKLDELARAAGAAHYFKQWGGTRPESAGRELDGRVIDGMPTHVPGAMPGAALRLHLPIAGDQ